MAETGERDKLLTLLMFETGLRVSEALSLRPRLIGQSEGQPVIYLKKGKGRKPRMVACSEDLAHRIKSYAYSKEIGIDDRIFPINRKRAWQIAKLAGEKTGIQKEVYLHLLRHSDAIERLRQTGNPSASLGTFISLNDHALSRHTYSRRCTQNPTTGGVWATGG